MALSEIITDGGRRRHWNAAEKLRIVEETLDGQDSTSIVARRNGVAPNLLYLDPAGLLPAETRLRTRPAEGVPG